MLERDYCLAWFLVGLSTSSLREHLVFKGGTALKRCYFGDYRFSEDLDFTLAAEMPLESILTELEDVYAEVGSASGIPFRYSRGDRKRHLNSHTFYLTYEGPLPSASPREVKVDITINERFVLPIEDRAVLRGYDEYADLIEDSQIRVYSLDEIGVEKVVALTDRARNEPRDLYDVWYLTSEDHVDLAMLTGSGVVWGTTIRGRYIGLSDLAAEHSGPYVRRLVLAHEMLHVAQFRDHGDDESSPEWRAFHNQATACSV